MSELPQITSPKNASVNKDAFFDFSLTSNIEDAAYSVFNLPYGLNYSSADRKITGIPTVGGEYKISIVAENTVYAAKDTLILTVSDSAADIVSFPALSISSSSANLLGDVNQTGGVDPSITVHWGDENAGLGTWDNNHSLGTKEKGRCLTLFPIYHQTPFIITDFQEIIQMGQMEVFRGLM